MYGRVADLSRSEIRGSTQDATIIRCKAVVTGWDLTSRISKYRPETTAGCIAKAATCTPNLGSLRLPDALHWPSVLCLVTAAHEILCGSSAFLQA
eukprot:scaffold706_cov418-Prasinococcus_capsulatus_cf.AAC.64